MTIRFYRFILWVVVFFVSSPSAVGWGFYGHRLINYHAVFLVPSPLFGFFKTHIRYLADHATDADSRRYALKEEAPRHYIDMDRYRLPDSLRWPIPWNTAVGVWGEDSLHAHGIVPWWIMTMKYRLQKAFEEKDVPKILKLSADIGHYISDAHVPLHASSNHNGQLTDQLGIHAFWESRLPELYAEQEYDLVISPAQYFRAPLDWIWDRVRESAAAADTVLTLEKQLSRQFRLQDKMSYEQRNGVVVRNYSKRYSSAYHDRLEGMVERRLRQSMYTVASFWYTAWVDAGQPELPSTAP